MYIITYKGKPATLGTLFDAETLSGAAAQRMDTEELDAYMSAKTIARLKEIYVYHFGFTWQERAEGVEIKGVLSGSLFDVPTKRL